MKVFDLLNSRLRVVMSDGRELEGTLMCTDQQCNVILTDCHEINQTLPQELSFIGRTLVPGKYITKVSIKCVA